MSFLEKNITYYDVQFQVMQNKTTFKSASNKPFSVIFLPLLPYSQYLCFIFQAEMGYMRVQGSGKDQQGRVIIVKASKQGVQLGLDLHLFVSLVI